MAKQNIRQGYEGPACSRLAAKWSLAAGSNAPACAGPCRAQTPSSPCVVRSSVGALRIFGNGAGNGLQRDFIPQIRRTPGSQAAPSPAVSAVGNLVNRPTPQQLP